jgi:7-carboxy-7-deazaguanine synthase
MNGIPINEIFESIQGEGNSLGIPSIFIRMFGCNLRCTFDGDACDTPYAVEGEEVEYWEEDALVTYLYSDNFKAHHIIFTMLYQDKIYPVIMRTYELFTHEIETNGTIAPKQEMSDGYCCHFTVSPKLKSSHQKEGYENKRYDLKVLNTFPQDVTTFKFVINEPDNDVEEIKMIQEGLTPRRKYPFFLMPEGITREEVLANSQEVVKICIENGWRFSPREHINIWDKRRGV